MTIDGIAVAIDGAVTVYEAARRVAIQIPVLCHRADLHPTGGCGVCTVEDAATGRLLPACATPASESMAILTASPDALQARRDALELLLSNHPADCEAPCQMACPSGLPVPRLLEAVAAGRWAEAERLARIYPVTCGNAAPCEKACRRRALGGPVAICALHRWLAGIPDPQPPAARPPAPRRRFRARMTGLSEETLLTFCAETGTRRFEGIDPAAMTRAHAAYEAARCLQCGCRKPNDCLLRELCTEAGARQSAFAGAHGSTARERSDRFCFDAARCVLCGICVRTAGQLNASIAPAFHGRGFAARIAPPLGRVWSDIPAEILAACAAACPTGAMTLLPSADREEQEDPHRPERM